MVANIWLSSSIALATIFSATIAYKSYSDIKEAKEIQQSYEIISQVKELIAKQYNKNPQDISRDEIIAYLPKGPNWEKVLLVSRLSGSNLSNDALVDEDGNFVLSSDEKIKLLALTAKLKQLGMENTKEISSGGLEQNSLGTSSNTNPTKVKFKMGMGEKNFSYKDNIISSHVSKVIEILQIKKTTLSSDFDTIIKNYTPYESIYQDMKKSDDEKISDSIVKTRKEVYFKKRIKEKLLSSKNARDMDLYNLIKDRL